MYGYLGGVAKLLSQSLFGHHGDMVRLGHTHRGRHHDVGAENDACAVATGLEAVYVFHALHALDDV